MGSYVTLEVQRKYLEKCIDQIEEHAVRNGVTRSTEGARTILRAARKLDDLYKVDEILEDLEFYVLMDIEMEKIKKNVKNEKKSLKVKEKCLEGQYHRGRRQKKTNHGRWLSRISHGISHGQCLK